MFRSPLSVTGQFEEAIPDTELIVIEGADHMSSVEQPEYVKLEPAQNVGTYVAQIPAEDPSRPAQMENA